MGLKLLKRLHRQCRMHNDGKKISGHAGDSIQILRRIIKRPALQESLIQMCLRPAQQKRVAIGRGAHDSRCAKRATPSTNVFDDNSAQRRFHLFRPRPSNEVERAAWWKRNNKSHRPSWIGLSDRRTAAEEQRGCGYSLQ